MPSAVTLGQRRNLFSWCTHCLHLVAVVDFGLNVARTCQQECQQGPAEKRPRTAPKLTEGGNLKTRRETPTGLVYPHEANRTTLGPKRSLLAGAFHAGPQCIAQCIQKGQLAENRSLLAKTVPCWQEPQASGEDVNDVTAVGFEPTPFWTGA